MDYAEVKTAHVEDCSHKETSYIDDPSRNGQQVLHELTKVDAPPDLTLRNVLRSTDRITTINCLALTLLYFAGIMALNVPPTQIQFMVADLGEAGLVSWISTASSASIAAVLLSSSGLTDVLGRRYAMLLGCVLGVVGGCVSGAALSTKMIIAGQAITGAAIGLAFISAAAVAEIVPAFSRPFWGTILHTVGAVGQLLGPLYAGALVKQSPSGWRWSFYIDAIIFGLCGILIFLTYRVTSRVNALGLSKRQIAREFDYVGVLFFVGGIVSLLVGLSFGAIATYGWKTAHSIAPTVVGCLTILLALPLWERFRAVRPFLERDVFRDRTFILLNVITFVNGFVLLVANVYLPQLLKAFWESDPFLLSVDRMPLFGCVTLFQTIAGFMFQRTGRYRWAYIFYSFCLLLGPALFAILQPSYSIGVILGISTITGIAIGGTTQLSFVAAQYCIPQEKMGLGLGFLNTIRSVGGAVGVAIFNTVFNSRQLSHVSPKVVSAAVGAGASEKQAAALVKVVASKSQAALLKAAGGNADVVETVVHAYKEVTAQSYRIVFLAIIPFGVAGLVASFFLREVTHYMSEETVFGVRHETVLKAGLPSKDNLEADHIERI